MKALITALALVAMIGTAHADGTTTRTRTQGNGDRVTTDEHGHTVEHCHTLTNGDTVTRDTAGRITERTRTTSNGDQVTTTYDSDDEGDDQ